MSRTASVSTFRQIQIYERAPDQVVYVFRHTFNCFSIGHLGIPLFG